MRHELKTDPQHFDDVLKGKKTHEIRFDDRGYKKGDELLLKETASTGREMRDGAPLLYSGRHLLYEVTHVMRGPAYGLKAGWVILSIKRPDQGPILSPF